MRAISAFLAILVVALVCVAIQASAAPEDRAGPPKSIAGLSLGEDVSAFKESLNMGTDQTIWNQGWFRQVEIKTLPGFQGGYLFYGNCLDFGRVVRIKLKYADDSPGFFDRLQAALQDRYGRGEWRGDPFGTLRAWKWGFTDERGDSISLILEHYSGEDESYTAGNSIRLANRSAMLREKTCGEARLKKDGKSQAPAEAPSFDWYLPK